MPRRRRFEQEPVEYLEPSHIDALEEAASNIRDQILVRTIFRTGCRISEVLAMRPGDVSFSRRTITIARLKERLLLKCPECMGRLSRRDKFCGTCGKAVPAPLRELQEQHSRRTVMVDQGTVDMIRDYVSRDPRFRQDPNARLFPFTPQWARLVIAKLAVRCNLPPIILANGHVKGVSPHRLRDAFATRFISAMEKAGKGDDAYREVQEQLGHASIATTFRYRKLASKERRVAYDQVFGGGEATT